MKNRRLLVLAGERSCGIEDVDSEFAAFWPLGCSGDPFGKGCCGMGDVCAVPAALGRLGCSESPLGG